MSEEHDNVLWRPLTPEEQALIKEAYRPYTDWPTVSLIYEGAPPDAPPPGADADAWLDWRAKKKTKGEWYRLEKIAEWSGYTIAQLKYKSSLRKPRGTPKTPPKNKKKVE